jgi:periplasmic divalent cation tolerance protein
VTSSEDGVCVVLVTAPDTGVATRLVRTVVEERLATCGNIVPGVRSIYRWNGELHEESEVLIVLKTTASASTLLAGRVPQLHPYDVPEVIVLPVVGGHAPYLEWVRAGTAGEG